MSGKFEIYQDRAGQFRFRLKAGNGQVLAEGEGYSTKEGARRGIEAVQRAAAGAEISDATSDPVSGPVSGPASGLTRGSGTSGQPLGGTVEAVGATTRASITW